MKWFRARSRADELQRFFKRPSRMRPGISLSDRASPFAEYGVTPEEVGADRSARSGGRPQRSQGRETHALETRRMIYFAPKLAEAIQETFRAAAGRVERRDHPFQPDDWQTPLAWRPGTASLLPLYRISGRLGFENPRPASTGISGSWFASATMRKCEPTAKATLKASSDRESRWTAKRTPVVRAGDYRA